MSNKPELKHVAKAREYIGLKEKTANRHPTIDKWATELAGKWLVGQPWCGTFMAHVFGEVGLKAKVPKDFYRAKAWEQAGTKLDKPAYGCVVTFTRDGGGHVGLVVGITKGGMLKVLGGNQGDAVNISDFSMDRVTAYRWVSAGVVPEQHRYELPVLPAGRISTNEA